MTHNIEKGQVTVLKCVTPGSYWIRCKACKESCRTPTSIRLKPFSGDYYPHQGASVFVTKDGFFYRGVVCGRRDAYRSPIRKYVVQLIDTFQVQDFDRLDIYPTFGEDSVNCESAHFVSLINALPSLPPLDFTSSRSVKKNECAKFERDLKDWDRSNDVVEDLLQRNVPFTFESKATLSGSLYGCLMFSDGEQQDLKHFLAIKKIVVRVGHQFTQLIEHLKTFPPSADINLLPTFAPDSFVEQLPIQYYDLSKLRVHELDKNIHDSLWTEWSTNILFTKPPAKNDIVIRYVAPEGFIAIGTILRPCVFVIEKNELDTRSAKPFLYDPELKSRNLLINPLRAPPEEMPPSRLEGTVNISTFNHNLNLKPIVVESLLHFNFEDSVQEFSEVGGIIKDHATSSLTDVISQLQLQCMRNSFESLQLDKLELWQKVCMPSFMAKKNITVIGPKSLKKMTTSLICTLVSMKTSADAQSARVSPMCVIFVPDFERAKKIALVCDELANFKVLITTSSSITDAQRAEAQAGCDLMITTIGNWIELTNHCNCFKNVCLSYVIFDSIEKLHTKNDKILYKVFKNLVGLSNSQRLQTIVLSNVWDPLLVDYVKLMNRPTLCVLDRVQEIFCYRTKTFVVFVSNDWEMQLDKIIKNDPSTFRVLLCKDSIEVCEIEDRMKNFENCMICVHEKEERNTILKKIDLWKTRGTVFLVCSDIVFGDLNFTNKAGSLISWMKTNTREKLNQRFAAIKEHPIDTINNLSIYFFCDSTNLSELTFTKELLEGVKGCEFIGGCFDKLINEAVKPWDVQKTHMRLCSNVFMFGHCSNIVECTFRHNFLCTDELCVIGSSNYLEIELLKVHNISHLTVRVLSITGNSGLINSSLKGLCSNLMDIDNGLMSAFGEKVLHPLNLNKLRVGDIVGACFNKNILKRVEIIDINDSGAVRVLSIDYFEPIQILPFSTLFNLPLGIQSYPRDVTEIYVSGLVPINFDCDWKYETSCFIENYLALLEQEHSTLAKCKLLAGECFAFVERSVIVETLFYCAPFNAASVSITHSFKESALATGYVTNNPDHLRMLSNLAIECGKDFCHRHEHYLGSRNPLPTDYNNAVVSAYDHPGLFYIQLISETEDLKLLEKRLNITMTKSKRSLIVIAPGELCAVKIDNSWNRAIVLSPLEKEESNEIVEHRSINNSLNGSPKGMVGVMCVDYGDTHSCSIDELFCLPEKFSIHIPFFSMECELDGIKPTLDYWISKATDEFKYKIRSKDDLMLPLSVKFSGVSNTSGVHSRHRVELRTLNTSEPSINEYLVRQGVAHWNTTSNDLSHC